MIKNITDAAAATTGLTAAWWTTWIAHLEPVVQVLMMIGGLLFLYARLALVIREWFRGRKSKD